MKVTTVSYTAHINLGNYESEEICVTADTEGGSVAQVIDVLRQYVEANTLRPGWVSEHKTKPAAAASPAPPKAAKPADPFDGLE